MKVLNFTRPENGMTEDPLYYFDFERYEDETEDFYLFMADFYGHLYSGYYNDKTKVVLTLEEPNSCVSPGEHVALEKHADHILTLCPYTAELSDKRQFVFFPTNEAYIPGPNEIGKEIDVCYFGSLPTSVPWQSYIDNVLSKYDFAFGHYSQGNLRGCSYTDKMQIYGLSKVAVVHGLCNIRPETIEMYRSFPRAYNNKALSHLDKGMAPQIKSRMFEAAFGKCVILCQKDPWNPIENFFEPEKDFLYFENEEDLKKILSHVLDNYDDFTEMRMNAYNKAINNYTVRHFVENFLK